MSSEGRSFPHPLQPPSQSVLPSNLDLISSRLCQSPVLAPCLPGMQLVFVTQAPPQVSPLPLTLRSHVSVKSLASLPLAGSHSTMLLFSSFQGLPIPPGHFKRLLPKACFCCWTSHTLICALTSCNSPPPPSLSGVLYTDPDIFIALTSHSST